MSDKELTMTGKKELQSSINVGAVSIEQERAIAEAQGQLILAKRFPRDVNVSWDEFMNSCKQKSMAEGAFYNVPGRGNGPSIRLAEEASRCWGNLTSGSRELSRSEKRSEVEVYAQDLQTNRRVTRQLTIMHQIEVKDGNGGKKIKYLTDPNDINSLIANISARQLRGCIMAVLPKWFVQNGVDVCKQTMAGNNDETLVVKSRKLITAFAKFGVTLAHVEKYLKHPLTDILLDEYIELMGIGVALKDGAKASEYFPSDKIQSPDVVALNTAVLDALKTIPTEKKEVKTEFKKVEEPDLGSTDDKPVIDPLDTSVF